MGWNYDDPVMHGNLGASTAPSDGDAASCAVWFGNPAAQDLFDASALCAPDRERLRWRPKGRREQEFKVSRALKAFADADAHSYSLSHSAGHAALLVAPAGVRVGVDLEAVRPRDCLRIARFAFAEREVGPLEAALGADRDQMFYMLWTLKEAIGKALQLPLLDALAHCVFTPGADGWTGSAPTHLPWSAQVFRVRPGFLLAAAFVGIDTPPKLQQWEWPPQRAGGWPVIACATAAAAAGAPPA